MLILIGPEYFLVSQMLLVGVPVLVFLVAVVDVLAVSGGIVGHVQVVVVTVKFVYSFSLSFFSPTVLLLLLLFVVPVNDWMGRGYVCHRPAQDYHLFYCCCFWYC